MNLRAIALGTAGLGLLALAGGLVPSPRLVPRPDLPEIAPFAPGERIALILPAPETFPSPDTFGLVQRARAAGAEVRVFALGDSLSAFAPHRTFQPGPEPCAPAGYHPDQWPAWPPDETNSANGWQMLILTPQERIVLNQAVLAAARAFRTAGDIAREADMLSRARRAELYRSLKK